MSRQPFGDNYNLLDGLAAAENYFREACPDIAALVWDAIEARR